MPCFGSQGEVTRSNGSSSSRKLPSSSSARARWRAPSSTKLRDYQPVIGVVAGSVGCFGGMSIAAGLCSYLVVTREARVGLNGPQVIEQEAGLDEYDSRDRPFIWSLTGGEQRYASGMVDAYVADDTDAIRAQLHELFALGKPLQPRSRRHAWYLQRLADVDTRTQLDAAAVRALYEGDAQ